MLDTETKGTGAHVVPLDSVERDADAKPRAEIPWSPPKKTPREPKPEPPRVPRRFRIVDVLTRAVLLEDGLLREALAVLGGVERMNDVNVFIWEADEDRWRLLSFSEQEVVWKRRPTG